MKKPSTDNFPLATALSKELHPFIVQLENGEHCELLDQLTPTTAELIKYWFHVDYQAVRNINFHQGQRDAILSMIYAHEVISPNRLLDLYQAISPDALLEEGKLGEVTDDNHQHPKYAAKMATGTGKTWVLNALLIWQYLNKLAQPNDNRFTKNFLIVAPGLIVYDRLLDSFLGKEHDGVRNPTTSDLYLNQELFIPQQYRDAVFQFVQSSTTTKTEIGSKVTSGGLIAITNWHLLAGEEDPYVIEDEEILSPGEDKDPKRAIESFFPVSPGKAAGNSLDMLDRRFSRGTALQYLVDLPDLLVFNDEAHHIHQIKKGGETTDVEWQKSLSKIASTKSERFVQIDFSATPYNETGGKNNSKQYFPHIVVDFDLKDAMRLGLVKSLALDKRREVASLPLDFKVERDEQNKVVGLSHGQRVMLNAGLKKLSILESQFEEYDEDKCPKLLIVCEDTNVTPYVEEYLIGQGLAQDDILTVDSGKKQELGIKEWEPLREKLFDLDKHKQPKVIISVLMLREGFDVNNICVIVPLRASKAQILLEQTLGRGLRLMWRGEDAIEELKQETRERIRSKLEPTNFFDVLFIVEHPAFNEFYEELQDDGLLIEIEDDADKTRVTGDIEVVGLRDGYEQFDFSIPVILRDSEEEMMQPMLDPMVLPQGKFVDQLDWLKSTIGKGDKFVSEDIETKTQYGDYRVDGGVMTATGYNDYLSRMTNRITEALDRKTTKGAKHYKDIAKYPLMQTYKPLLLGWIDVYVRHRLFDQEFDPQRDENWRVLLIQDVVEEIASTFATKLVEIIFEESTSEVDVTYRKLSEVDTIKVREGYTEEVTKCIFPKLPIPAHSGGLERLFIQWLESDTLVDAFIKISEQRHDFLHRMYLKADGMPASYSPDFLVRTPDEIYVVETKAESSLSDENVQRKKKSALSWCEKINKLDAGLRDNKTWHYVLLGESNVRSWKEKNARVSELLEYSKVVYAGPDSQGSLL